MNFDDFVSGHAARASEDEKLDLAAQKGLWLNKLGEFYKSVEHFLGTYIAAGSIKFEKFEVFLREDQLGEYQADAGRITVGDTIVKLQPIGTFLIGARGRIDMIGPRGTVKFLLVPPASRGLKIEIRTTIVGQPSESAPVIATAPPSEWVWKIASPPPRLVYTELTAESFQGSLMSVVNG
jgi:hypothetical protein